MSSFLVAGYKNFELGIFSEKDPKLSIIKKAIRQDLIHLLDNGLDWLVFQGNLGFEYWVLTEAQALIEEGYDLALACIFPFANHGQSWSENNQLVLEKFRQLDYVNHSFSSYDNPSQLRQHQEFLLNNTQGAYIFYDEENETNLKYLFAAIKEREDYDYRRLDFERLNDLAQDY